MTLQTKQSMSKEIPEEINKMNIVCFWLIHACRETNAETMTVKQENVTVKGENVGDWEITVKRLN